MPFHSLSNNNLFCTYMGSCQCYRYFEAKSLLYQKRKSNVDAFNANEIAIVIRPKKKMKTIIYGKKRRLIVATVTLVSSIEFHVQ